MKRIILALVLFAALLLGACSSTSSGQHWPRTSGSQTLVRVAMPDWPDDAIEIPLRTGISRWGSESPHVEIGFVRTCPPEPTNCVYFRPSADLPSPVVAQASWSVDANKHILSAWIQMDTGCLATCTRATLRNVGCHEFGHTLGLGHGDTQGPCIDGWPTDWDLHWLDEYYNHTDSSAVTGKATPTKVMA